MAGVISIRLLGDHTVYVEQRRLKFRSFRANWLLALLVLAYPRPQSTEALKQFLVDTEADFPTSLLAMLRDHLGEDRIPGRQRHGPAVLHLDDVDVDVFSMRDGIRRGDLSAAAASYGGVFLDGLPTGDKPGDVLTRDGFRWLLRQRAELEMEYGMCASDPARIDDAFQQYKDAITNLSLGVPEPRLTNVHEALSRRVAEGQLGPALATTPSQVSNLPGGSARAPEPGPTAAPQSPQARPHPETQRRQDVAPASPDPTVAEGWRWEGRPPISVHVAWYALPGKACPPERIRLMYDSSSPYRLPPEIAPHKEFLVARFKQSTTANIWDGLRYRFCDWNVEHDASGAASLTIHGQPVTYYDYIATNGSLNVTLPGTELTVREALGKTRAERFANSANILSINITTIIRDSETGDEWALIAKRGGKNVDNPGKYGPTLSSGIPVDPPFLIDDEICSA